MVAPQAGIEITQEGLLLVAQRPEAETVLEAFLETEMGEGCFLLDHATLRAEWPMMRDAHLALHSPHDLRVESHTAIPRLAAWLAEVHSVEFRFSTAVRGIENGGVETARGRIAAETVIVCPGDDLTTLFPDLFASAGVTRCRLQMLRLAAPRWRMAAPVMSDLSLIRYPGYAALPAAAALRERLAREEAAALAEGIHLIAVQSADGSLIVGDSHHYAATPAPFATDAVDRLILTAYEQVLGPAPAVIARWTGTYASGAGHHFVAAPADGVRLVAITSGTGASTAFALAERVVSELYGSFK